MDGEKGRKILPLDPWRVRLCDLIIRGGLRVLLIVTPLAFGAVYVWGIALIQLVTVAMSLAWVFKLLHGGKLQVVRTPLNLPILLFLGLVMLQLLPLPPGVLRVVSPNTHALYERTLAGPYRELSSSFKDAGTGHVSPDRAKAQWRPLSLYPHATRAALVEAFAYGVVFFLVVNTIRTRAELRQLLFTLMGVGVIVAMVGLIQKASGATKIYGFWTTDFGGSFFGTYPSRNHFAGYMAMVIPLGLGWLWGQLVRSSAGVAPGGWKAHLIAIASRKGGRRLLLALALVNMTAAVLLSGSRGGIVSLVGALIFLSLTGYLPLREGRRQGIVIPAVTVIAFVYALWFGLHQTAERFSNFNTDAVRPLLWTGTFDLIADYPVLGTGLGTYMYGFRRHKVNLDTRLVDHAHNDYLELLAEVGAVGFLLVVGGIGWFCWHTLKPWWRRHDPEVRGIVLGGMSSMCAIALHSLVDFNLHIPANALLLAVILGLTSVALHLRRRNGQTRVAFRSRQLLLPLPLRLALYPVIGVAALALALPVAGSVAADQHARAAETLESEATGVADLEGVIEGWESAVALDVGNADYLYRLGLAYDRAMRAYWSSDPVHALRSGIQALAAQQEAILNNPASPFTYLALGWTLENVRQLAMWAVWQRELLAAHQGGNGDQMIQLVMQLVQQRAALWSRQLVQTATYLAPTTAFAHYSAGLYTLRQWKSLSADEQTRVIHDLRGAMLLEPEYAPSILQSAWEWTQDRQLVSDLARGSRHEARWRVDATPARSER